MGKNKGTKAKTKNVFKVAGPRSVRLKSKAQKVAITLKNLDLKGSKSVKEKTNHINKQLVELSKEVYQSGNQKKTNFKPSVQKKTKKNERKEAPSGPSKEQTANLLKNLQI